MPRIIAKSTILLFVEYRYYQKSNQPIGTFRNLNKLSNLMSYILFVFLDILLFGMNLIKQRPFQTPPPPTHPPIITTTQNQAYKHTYTRETRGPWATSLTGENSSNQ